MSGELTVQEDRPVLLTIETFVPDRQPVSIDGTLYEMRALNEFGVVQRVEIQRVWLRYYELLQKVGRDEPLNPDEAQVVDAGVERILRAALPDVPKEVFARIGSAHREALLRLFFQLTSEPAKVTPLPARRSTRSTGGRKSRASGASTARPTGG